MTESNSPAERPSDAEMTQANELRPAKLSSQEKKPRLFVRGSEATDDVSLYCGGNDGETTAAQGVANVLCEPIRQLMDGYFDGSMTVEFEVRMMSDAEIDEMPDV